MIWKAVSVNWRRCLSALAWVRQNSGMSYSLRWLLFPPSFSATDSFLFLFGHGLFLHSAVSLSLLSHLHSRRHCDYYHTPGRITKDGYTTDALLHFAQQPSFRTRAAIAHLTTHCILQNRTLRV